MNAPVSQLNRMLRTNARRRGRALRRSILPSLQRRRLQCYLAMMVTDLAMLATGFDATGYATHGAIGLAQASLVVQLLLPVFLTVGLYNGAYSSEALQRDWKSISRAVQALFAAGVVFAFYTFYMKAGGEFSRLDSTLGMVVTVALLGLSRLQMRRFVQWRCGGRVVNELVIDDGGPAISLPGAYHVCAAKFGLRPVLNDPHALDDLGLVMRNADRVVISTPPERRAAWAIILKGANVAGEVIDDTVAELAAHGARSVAGHGLLMVSSGPLNMRSRVAKRAFDMLVAGSAVLAISPLLLIVALAIKLEDRGPVFFVQRRVGRSNRFFPIYKFRSMTVNKVGRDGAQSASKSDQRITRIGKLIRSTSIDELPQLLNVLKGDMSLVGPRPHAIGSQAGDKLFWEVDERYWQRHALKPGLTGLAQIRGLRGATDCEQDLLGRLDADLEYLNGWSIWRDLWILCATARVLVHDKAF